MPVLESELKVTVLLLAAAVAAVSAFRLLRLSPILGYLAAGVALGPFGLGALTAESTHLIGEFGVIFLLFVIGLELSTERLKRLRRHVFGFGMAQMLLTSTIIAGMCFALGLTPEASIVIGGALALSSTALVMQVADEQGIKTSQVGRVALATLILQDLMVIPLLVMVEVFALKEESLFAALGQAGLQAAVGVTVIVGLGRLLLRPTFRFIASLGYADLLTATILLVVLATAYGSHAAGLSPALGAFIAGVLIAETEFRPQVEADIMPFKGLLLGLFFMTVGMSLDIELLTLEWSSVLMIACALILGKALLMAFLGRLFGFGNAMTVQLSLLLAQGGEFAFALFTLAAASGVIEAYTGQLLLVAVTLSMGVTPLLAHLGRRAAQSVAVRSNETLRSIAEETRDLSNHIVVSGFGRVGKTVSQLFEAEGITYLALDINAEAVAEARKRGKPVHYGDASRRLVLKAIGLERARAVIITHADAAISLRTILAIREHYPDIPIIARAKNYTQVAALELAGASLALAEMFETSLQLGAALLREIGMPDYHIARRVEEFRENDYARMREGVYEAEG